MSGKTKDFGVLGIAAYGQAGVEHDLYGRPITRNPLRDMLPLIATLATLYTILLCRVAML